MFLQASYVRDGSLGSQTIANLESRFDNLIMRYEEPSSMVRWDSPLFTIPWDEDPPFEDIWNAIIKGDKKPPTSAVLQVSIFFLLTVILF